MGKNFLVMSVKEATGEGQIFLSRGKKRIGYHLGLTFEFEGTGDVYLSRLLAESEFQI
jgi:pyridoxal/pyridoxine/pyridoxamine kinase